MRKRFGFFGIVIAFVGLVISPRPAVAQDAFEIEVYRAETAPRKAWELETHLSYTVRGTTTYDGTIAPTRHQARLALELTRGITGHWDATVYALSAYRADAGFEYAGWRARTRVRLPESWRLPVDVTLATELEFARAGYDENAMGLEFRPILEKRIGRLLLDLNPVIERGLKGRDGADAGEWEMEPSARVGFTLSRAVDLSFEYFGKTGFPGSPLPADERAHAFYPGVDLTLGDDFVLSVGVGFGTASSSNRLVFKGRFEVPLGS